MWISAITVVRRSKWTPELFQEIGKNVLDALFYQIQDNQKNPDFKPIEDMTITELVKMENSKANAVIVINSN